MGQTNSKEGKQRKRSGVAGTRSGVRPPVVSDAVFHHAHPSASPSGAAGDPSWVSSSRGSVASNRNSTAITNPSSPNASVSVGLSVPAAPGAGMGNERTYPVVLRYVDKDVQHLIQHQGKLFVAVEAMGWKPLPMTPSADSFYALLELPQGNHNYRFILDGKEVVDSTQPMAPATAAPAVAPADAPAALPPRDGRRANTIFLNANLLTTKEDDAAMDDGTGWGQDAIIFEESRKYPPIVPLHLRYTPLNTPPTLVRCSKDGRLAVVDEDSEQDLRMPPEHLPLPLSVTINHVYFQRRENHAVMGVTTRYCNKYTTVVYYTQAAPSCADALSATT